MLWLKVILGLGWALSTKGVKLKWREQNKHAINCVTPVWYLTGEGTSRPRDLSSYVQSSLLTLKLRLQAHLTSWKTPQLKTSKLNFKTFSNQPIEIQQLYDLDQKNVMDKLPPGKDLWSYFWKEIKKRINARKMLWWLKKRILHVIVVVDERLNSLRSSSSETKRTKNRNTKMN